MIRFLRPDRVVRGADAVWLVDEAWPVAAKLVVGEPLTPVAWPWPDHLAGVAAHRVVVADGVGLVTGIDGQVAWVRRDGCTVAQVEAGLVLSAADPEVAWFVDRTPVDPGAPPTAPPPLPPGRIVTLGRDGSSQQVITTAPVIAVDVRDAEVWVRLADLPVARPGRRRGSWWFRYPSSVFRVTRQRLFVDGLASAVPALGEASAGGSPNPALWTWLAEDAEWTLRHGVAAGGLMWDVGAPTGGDKINRHALVVGYDPAGDRPAVHVDLGLGLVRDAQAIGDELWVIVARRRLLAVPLDRGVDVLAVSASGVVQTVYQADTLDVSQSAPPLRRLSDEQIDDHVEQVRRRLDHREKFWRSADDATSPLSEGSTTVSVEGDWPDTRVVVTLHHPHRPGLELRRTLPLFDEQGSPIDHTYADAHLVEDLDTNYLAPADEAVDGVLDT